MRNLLAIFSILLSGVSAAYAAQAAPSTPPHIQYFYARSQSPYYLGNTADGTPQFVAGKAMEFEFLACPTNENDSLQAIVYFGNGEKRVFSEVSCSPTIFPYTYVKPQSEAIAALEVKNAAGKTDLQAVKISVAPLPKDTKTVAAAFGPPVITESALPAVAARPTPEVAVGQDLSKQLTEDTSSAKVAEPGAQISADQTAPAQQASASTTATAGSPILGAFVTGVLILLFFVAAFSGIRWLLTR